MKKTAIASVAFAVALFSASCQKEATLEQRTSGPMTISAVAEGLGTPTKTEMIFKYDVAWNQNDKVYVVDGQGNDDTFTLQSGAGTTKGTFKQDGTISFTGEVQAYYPATMLDSGSPVWPASQTNDQTIPMYCKKTLSGETTESMDFSSLGSVLQIVFNTTQENITLKSIEIKDGSKTMSGAFHVDGNGQAVIDATDKAGITLDLGAGVALDKSANYFNIAIPAGDYQDLTLVFTTDNGRKCTMTGGKVNISRNTVGRLTLMGEKFISQNILPGKFSVGNDGGTMREVYFSKGNLYYDGAYKFETNQHDYNSSQDMSHLSYFFWSKDPSNATSISFGDSNTNTSDIFFTNASATTANPDFTVNDEKGKYRTLSKDEWNYLLNERSVNGGTGEGKSYSLGINYGNCTGLVLYPDNYTGTVLSGRVESLPEGVVFLPSVGYYSMMNFYEGGYYWSSSASDSNNFYACVVNLNNLVDYFRFSACAVRLVMDVSSSQDFTVSVSGVTLSKNETTVNVGAQEVLVAIVTPSNATNKQVTWSSSSPNIASVDANGTVKGESAGSSVITASTADGSFTASCTVNVIVKVTGISLSKRETTLNVDAQETLVANVTPTNATNKQVKWSSLNSSVARVSPEGIVTGVATGSTIITATTVDGSFSASCLVSVSNSGGGEGGDDGENGSAGGEMSSGNEENDN